VAFFPESVFMRQALCVPTTSTNNNFSHILCGHYDISDYSTLTLLNIAVYFSGMLLVLNFKGNRAMARLRGNWFHVIGSFIQIIC
jgi:hypothetical protein